jgi:hypothetical protein
MVVGFQQDEDLLAEVEEGNKKFLLIPDKER